MSKGRTNISRVKKYNNSVAVDASTQIDEIMDKEFGSIQFDMSLEEIKHFVMNMKTQ